MALENPLFQQANTVPARHLRGLVQALVDTEGVLRPSAGGLLAAQRAAGTNMSVDVAAGSCFIAGDDEANQGSYFCRSTAVENVVIGAAPGSNSRIDLIVARVRDATVTGVSSDWILEVIPGAVAASPVVPSTPNTAIPLAKVTVATGTTAITNAMITDLRMAAGNASYARRSAPWLANTFYKAGELVTNGGMLYAAKVDFTSGASFNAANWDLLGSGTVLISETVVSGTTTKVVTFSGIPATYRALELVITARTDRTTTDQVILQFNGDTGGNYFYEDVESVNATVTAVGAGAATGVFVGSICGADATAGAAGTVRVAMPQHANTAFHKGLLAAGGSSNGAAAANQKATQVAGRWASTAAVTSITLTSLGNLIAGSTFSLYGVL
jgi:hypothetical protein